MHPVTAEVTERIEARSRETRVDYLARMEAARHAGTGRGKLSCANWAHAFAAEDDGAKQRMRDPTAPNVAIVSAYNDMLSAHQPLERYPAIIKQAAREVGAAAQYAGGVPAMCDGVTQGRPGMELSLFSRDVIAMATAVALTHDAFDAALMLGICDKIVPGLTMGALSFGHLPTIFVPAGPMTSGISNAEKARVRALYAQGKVTREELLDSEMASYHGPGTCTFYGTANSNQMMMEMMGLHVPSAAFVNPGTKLRQALTRAAVHRLAEIGWDGDDYRPLGRCVDEKAIVNAAVGLLATGGSTNHLIHLPAIAAAAGITIDWEDFDRLSRAVPLIARVYPNGSADVNGFEDAGGMAFVIRELLSAGLIHRDVMTVSTGDMAAYAAKPALDGHTLVWRDPGPSRDETILSPVDKPFSPEGGFRILKGNIGRACIKVSAVDRERWTIEAPARVFTDQAAVLDAFKAGELDRDVVVVVRFQGPRANGMPELHKLTPALGVIQNRGYKVALVTDGRMSGASGKVPCAIHVSPEALGGGPIGKIQDGDLVRVDAVTGELQALVDEHEWAQRPHAEAPAPAEGMGRELFALMRATANEAERGGSAMLAAMHA